ncbi:MAG: hypothetical protein LBK58_11295 [Prevotellaceae bacterium]|nr:hypothetical protein [Prevotellaceae bacterium]
MAFDAQNPENPELAESKKAMMALFPVLMQGSTVELKADGTIITIAMGETVTAGTYTTNGGFKITSMEGYDASSFKSSTLEKGVLTVIEDMIDELDEDFDAEGGKTYRQEGFIKYENKTIFKK